MAHKRILFVGLGDVGSNILDFFVRTPGQHTFLVGGRKPEVLRQRTNLSLFAAMQLGFFPEIQIAAIDLWNREQTAETIARFQPDIIFCAATLQKWGAINTLPSHLKERLYQAQIGPWLPVHLTLVYKLMLAVQQAGVTPKVVNATYPDVVHPVLNKVGLAPTTGIGDLANNIPAIRRSISIKLGVPVEEVEVRLVAQHHVSYWMSRKGTSGGAPFYFRAFVNGEDISARLSTRTLFNLLPGELKRAPGNLMTAVSAEAVFDGLINNTGKLVHVPGPNGLPGGYPARVNKDGVQVELPAGITLEEAISINTTAQQFDGIERIDQDGTVHFVERHMAIFKELLGYECLSMPLAETEERARELLAKYAAFAQKYV
ncbi:MAG TPA: hypothetical protein VFV38_35480 [Ktedonobacteraceae bacterium]|nr:hypothetical protein [Ktedonobacteraceae bacterium]